MVLWQLMVLWIAAGKLPRAALLFPNMAVWLVDPLSCTSACSVAGLGGSLWTAGTGAECGGPQGRALIGSVGNLSKSLGLGRIDQHLIGLEMFRSMIIIIMNILRVAFGANFTINFNSSTANPWVSSAHGSHGPAKGNSAQVAEHLRLMKPGLLQTFGFRLSSRCVAEI